LPKILIAGASGFIGQELIKELELDEDFSIVALSRQEPRLGHARLVWLKADLFSLKDISEAMRGCDQVIYLVHSMLPSAALVQGTFYDTDLILADNLARAAKENNIQQVIYLGGLIPDEVKSLSWHLKSRLEVEEVLKPAARRVTILRAALVLGRGGSSFAILRRLVARLPVMLCPSWTSTLSQPIDVRDVVAIIKKCLVDENVQGRIWDIGGASVLSYREMLSAVAQALGKKPRMISVGTFSLNLSRFWVTFVTGAPKDLVYPLVQSLRYPMVTSDERRFTAVKTRTFDESVKYWVGQSGVIHAFAKSQSFERTHLVRSVQRMMLPLGKSAQWVAAEYFRWLPRFFSLLIRVELEDKTCRFYFLLPRLTLLLLERSIERSTEDRQLLYIRGGLLAHGQGRGRLEFREVLERRFVLAAIHDFHPRLPWFVYKYTQAVVHLIVMKAFGRHLEKIKEG
jgi:uncharacterized protein YbjT (DUF2867 family)